MVTYYIVNMGGILLRRFKFSKQKKKKSPHKSLFNFRKCASFNISGISLGCSKDTENVNLPE